MFKENLNKVVDLEKWEQFAKNDNQMAFVQMMGLYMGEFSWETAAEWEDANPGSEVIDKVTDTISRFCLDCVLKRHKPNRISAVWVEGGDEDESPNLEESFVDNGDGTISYDLNDFDTSSVDGLVYSPYDEESGMTYVIAVTKDRADNNGVFLLELVGTYKGYPDDTITDTIALTRNEL